MWLCGESVNGLKENYLSFDIIIYPNPGNGKINFICNDNMKHEIKIINIQGCQVAEYKIENNATVTIESFVNGIYFLLLTVNTKKICFTD
jgi:hypothetical protein